jgi:uncharacterized protein GlcG (DUF336 family)
VLSGIEINRDASVVHLQLEEYTMRRLTFVSSLFLVGCLLVVAPAQEPPAYGPAISLEQARKIVDAAEAEAKKQKWPVAIAVVDSAGYLVLFQRLDNTQLGSVEVSIEKAKTAVLYRRPTREFEERIAQGGAELKLLRLPGLPLEGGVPIVQDGKIIGGIGVSGVQSRQDAAVAAAGLEALENSEARSEDNE